METAVSYDSERRETNDEDRNSANPADWDWDNPIESRVVGTPGATLRLHLSRDEYVTLSRHAHAAGISTHEFIKRAALTAVQTPAR